MPATLIECTNREYHADLTRISASGLKAFVKSPRDYYERFVPQDDGFPLRQEPPTDAMILGSMTDCLVFTPSQYDREYITRPAGIDGRTTEGKKKLKEFRDAIVGKTEVTAEMRDKAHRMANAVLADEGVATLLEIGHRQRTLNFDDPEFGCKCRLRLDLMVDRPDMASDVVLDLKSASDPRPEFFASGGKFCQLVKFGYDLQMAHYSIGVSCHTGRPCSAGMIVVGSDPPHDVYLMDMGAWLEIGLQKRRDAIQDLLACRESGVWRRKDQGTVVSLRPNHWDYKGEFDE